MKISFISVFIVLFAGCAFMAQQLKQLPLSTEESIVNSKQTDKSILIYPLIDLRGKVYRYWYPTSFIPPVNLFHIGMYDKYPESTGMLRLYTGGGKPIVSVGSLPNSFPYLFANTIREMRLTNNVTPIEQINTKIDLNEFYFGRFFLTFIVHDLCYLCLTLLLIKILHNAGPSDESRIAKERTK